MTTESIEPSLCFGDRLRAVRGIPDLCGKERPGEPWPDSALMIGAVAAPYIAFVTRAISRIRPRQRAQSVWREQVALSSIQDCKRPFSTKEIVPEADGDHLVRTQGSIRSGVSDHIVKTVTLIVPKDPLEIGLQAVRYSRAIIGEGGVLELTPKLFNRAQRVIPKGLDFNRPARPRRNRNISDLGVHPGKLGRVVSCPEKTFVIGVNPVPRSSEVVVDDAFQRGIELFPDQVERFCPPLLVFTIFQVLPDVVHKPESGIDRVVFGRLTLIREAIGKHAAMDVLQKLKQDLFRCFGQMG